MGILVNMKKNAVILQKPSSTISIRADLTLEQRKFYNGLLFIAKETMKQNKDAKLYTISLNELKNLLSKAEQDKNNAYYKSKIKDLMHKVVEYNILEKDKIIEDSFVLVSRVKTVEDRKTGEVIINFEIPEFIREKLLNPENSIYANINLVIIRGLQSKYAIILYELAKDYEKVEVPIMELERFKKIFGIDNVNSYDRIDNLKARVLNKAVEELNNNENIDFTVTYKLVKRGKAYTHVKFDVKPKPKQKMLETKRDNMHLKVLLDAVPEGERTKNLEKYLAQCMKNYDTKYLLHQVEYVVKQKVKNFPAYLKKAIEEDYANNQLAEEQEQAEIERVKDVIKKRLEELQKEKQETIERRVDIEKSKIFEEYINLLEESKRQKLFEEYKEKVKELYPNVGEQSYEFEYKLEHLVTEDIIKDEIYQNRLEKARKKAEERAEIEYKMERDKLDYEIKNGSL